MRNLFYLSLIILSSCSNNNESNISQVTKAEKYNEDYISWNFELINKQFKVYSKNDLFDTTYYSFIQGGNQTAFVLSKKGYFALDTLKYINIILDCDSIYSASILVDSSSEFLTIDSSFFKNLIESEYAYMRASKSNWEVNGPYFDVKEKNSGYFSIVKESSINIMYYSFKDDILFKMNLGCYNSNCSQKKNSMLQFLRNLTWRMD